jgi:hypothetical protein
VRLLSATHGVMTAEDPYRYLHLYKFTFDAGIISLSANSYMVPNRANGAAGRVTAPWVFDLNDARLAVCLAVSSDQNAGTPAGLACQVIIVGESIAAGPLVYLYPTDHSLYHARFELTPLSGILLACFHDTEFGNNKCVTAAMGLNEPVVGPVFEIGSIQNGGNVFQSVIIDNVNAFVITHHPDNEYKYTPLGLPYMPPPTASPTKSPTVPTKSPTNTPTTPTKSPTNEPTKSPTAPTKSPTTAPTEAPTPAPTAPPTPPLPPYSIVAASDTPISLIPHSSTFVYGSVSETRGWVVGYSFGSSNDEGMSFMPVSIDPHVKGGITPHAENTIFIAGLFNNVILRVTSSNVVVLCYGSEGRSFCDSYVLTLDNISRVSHIEIDSVFAKSGWHMDWIDNIGMLVSSNIDDEFQLVHAKMTIKADGTIAVGVTRGKVWRPNRISAGAGVVFLTRTTGIIVGATSAFLTMIAKGFFHGPRHW